MSALDRAGAEIAAQINACKACAAEFAATPTAHAPRPVLQIGPTARLCVAGQAPGWRAHLAGRPFADPSGDRLRAWMGVAPETFYDPRRVALLPMAFCFPGHDPKGGDRPPPPRCAALWRARLMQAHPRLELILLVGGAAQRWALGRARGVTETVRDWRACYETERAGPRLLPTPHPSWRNTAWLRRNPWFEAQTIPFLRARVAELLARDASSSDRADP